MADKKLSELTETTTGSDTMQLFVNDGGVSKRITRGNLISGAVSAATTTYSIKAGTQIGGAGLELDAGGAGSGTDTVKLMESGSATVTRTDADTITIGATDTTYVDATTSVAGLMSTADKTKLSGIATSANNYTHPSGDGNLHVPATSTSNNGKVLTAGSTAGALTWETPIDTNTDTKWDGGSTGLNAATGRTSLGLGTAATSASTDFETADATILKDADIGSTVQAYDATIMVDADIGVTVQAYDADTTKNDVANTFTAIQKLGKGADIASATALALGTDGNSFDVTGTTTITSINTVGIGTHVTLQFDGALTLTHHATDLIIPGGANITTAAGDIAEFTEYATGDWRCTNYEKASGEAVVAGGATDIDGLSDGYTDSTNSSIGLGTDALLNNDGTANENVALGKNALKTNTSGWKNTALGYRALTGNTTGISNTAVGHNCAINVTTGNYNTAMGDYTLYDNITGYQNVAIGAYALQDTTTGYSNVAIGYNALQSGTTSSSNVAVGSDALGVQTSGLDNVAVGQASLNALTSGMRNTAIGRLSGLYVTTGDYNSYIGRFATGSSATASGEMTLGDTNVSNLRCNDTSISSLSDHRDKTNIQDIPDSAGIAFINKLRPVTYHWDRREWYDDGNPDGSKIKADWRRWKPNSGLKQGFIAQEVQTAISGEKCLEDSMIVTDDNPDKLEFAPQHLLTNAIKAIQQLSAENKALLARIEALENP